MIISTCDPCITITYMYSQIKLLLTLPPGQEGDDQRLCMDSEEGRSIEINNPGAYPTCCIELSLDNLAVNTVLQSLHINDYEGGSASSVSFDWAPQVLKRYDLGHALVLD